MPSKKINALIVWKKPENICLCALPAGDDTVLEIGRGLAPSIDNNAFLSISREFKHSDTVSRHHARILKKGDVYWIEHLSKTNLTRVDDKVVLSFKEFTLPCNLRLGEFSLELSEEKISERMLQELNGKTRFLKLSKAELDTKTAMVSLRKDWLEINEEMRRASSLEQIRHSIRAFNNPAGAIAKVSELICVFLSSQKVDLYFNILAEKIPDILKQSHLIKKTENYKNFDTIKFCNVTEATAFIIGESSLYVQPKTWRTDLSVNICIAKFKEKVPSASVSERATELVGLSLANLEIALSTSKVIEDSRQESRVTYNVKISDKMQKIREKIRYWGESPSFLKMLYEADIVGRRCLIGNGDGDLQNVLFVGEPGVGKTELARLIHQLSDHAKGPFIEVNCANIVSTLAESILFGTVKGFVPEVKDNIGLFEMAHNGVLFLDEIGNLPVDVQAKILSVLNSGIFNRLGDKVSRKTNCYVILATNADLETFIENGQFRADLYGRINTWEINIPPLRERKDDIPLLIEKALERLNNNKILIDRLGTAAPKYLDPDLKDLLTAYHWPGNIRELVRNIEAGFKKTNTAKISFKDLPIKLQRSLKSNEKFHIMEGANIDTGCSLHENILRFEIEYFSLLMRENQGIIQDVQKQAKISPTTFSKRRQSEYPELIKRLPKIETERLKEIAGPFWHKLILT